MAEMLYRHITREVSRDMAVDAGEPEMEGQPWDEEYIPDPLATRDAAVGKVVRVADWTLPFLSEQKNKLLQWKYAHRDVWTVEMQVALVCLSRYIAALSAESQAAGMGDRR